MKHNFDNSIKYFAKRTYKTFSDYLKQYERRKLLNENYTLGLGSIHFMYETSDISEELLKNKTSE